MKNIKQEFMPSNFGMPFERAMDLIQPISDQDCEAIQGGGHEERNGFGHSKELKKNAWKSNNPWNMPVLNGLVINIYQINLAINTILGGNGNSIVNVQGNNSAAA